MAKFMLGNEVREEKYWVEKKKRKCRRCGREEETWEYVWERYEKRVQGARYGRSKWEGY